VFLIAVVCLTTLPLHAAQGQVVSPSELREAVRNAAAAKQKNLDQVQSFFADAKVQAALAKGGMNADRVQKAVSTLNADELARLAARTSQIQNDFAAGALSNQDLTYIVIALAAAVLVLIIVAA
jgi:hypothetical protein